MENGEGALKLPLLKNMRAIKREILTLISTWVAKTDDTVVCRLGFIYVSFHFTRLFETVIAITFIGIDLNKCWLILGCVGEFCATFV